MTPMNDYATQCEQNAEQIESELSALDSGHWNLFQRQYKQFFAHAKEISELFRTIKPLKKEDRERLWLRFSTLCDDVRRQQTEGREQRERRSSTRRECIETELREARSGGLGASGSDEFAEAMQMLHIVREYINGRPLDAYDSASGPLLKADREELWEMWHDVNNEIHGHKLDVRSTNHSVLMDDAGDCLSTATRGNPHEAFAQIKAVQVDMKDKELSNIQREEIWSLLDDAAETAKERLAEIRSEKERRHQEWRERKEGHIRRWKDQISNLEDIRERIEQLISEDEERASSARTDEFADVVRGWIREKEDRISQIDESIEDLRAKIRDVESELN